MTICWHFMVPGPVGCWKSLSSRHSRELPAAFIINPSSIYSISFSAIMTRISSYATAA